MRQDCACIQQTTLMQAEVSTVDSGLHIVHMMESRWADVLHVVTEVHSVNPGVCMSAVMGKILLCKGREWS